jgi:hypothetical protein
VSTGTQGNAHAHSLSHAQIIIIIIIIIIHPHHHHHTYYQRLQSLRAPVGQQCTASRCRGERHAREGKRPGGRAKCRERHSGIVVPLALLARDTHIDTSHVTSHATRHKSRTKKKGLREGERKKAPCAWYQTLKPAKPALNFE